MRRNGPKWEAAKGRRFLCGEAVSALPASDCFRLRRAELFVTEMAEGELDVDSLISRLLEGEFTTKFYLCILVLPRVSP